MQAVAFTFNADFSHTWLRPSACRLLSTQAWHCTTIVQDRKYSGNAAYAQSKLANLMFSMELAPKVQARGVTVNCVHPGVHRTKVLNDGWGGGVGDAKVGHSIIVIIPLQNVNAYYIASIKFVHVLSPVSCKPFENGQATLLVTPPSVDVDDIWACSIMELFLAYQRFLSSLFLLDTMVLMDQYACHRGGPQALRLIAAYAVPNTLTVCCGVRL